MLNWHPVVEYEIREIEYKQREIEREKRLQQLRSETEQLRNETVQLQNEELQREIAHEQRMQQIASDTEQLRKENAREAELNAKIAAPLQHEGQPVEAADRLQQLTDHATRFETVTLPRLRRLEAVA